MHRREALQRVGVILGGTVIGAELFLSGCKNEEKKTGEAGAFSSDDVALLDEVAETIIPTTDSPGAKAAQVGTFMTVMVNDCYEEKNQKAFHQGITTLNDASEKKFKTSFMKATAEQKHELLVELDKEQREYQKSKDKDAPPHYFRMMKELTLLGYFTSEVGATKALRYVPVPGRYEGCIPYKKGDKAFV
jgi:hypothetical protein